MATDVVGSKMPSNNGYGQNGYQGPSSTCPDDDQSVGQSGFLPAVSVPNADWMTRKVGGNVPDGYGMKKPGV